MDCRRIRPAARGRHNECAGRHSVEAPRTPAGHRHRRPRSASSSVSTNRWSSTCRAMPTTFLSPIRRSPMRSPAPQGASTCSARRRRDEHLRLRPERRTDRQSGSGRRTRRRRPRGLYQALHSDVDHQGGVAQRQRRTDRNGGHAAGRETGGRPGDDLRPGGEATTGQYSQTAAGGDAAGGVAIDNPDQTRRTSAIVNLLTIIGDDQVTLKVTVAEVSRNVMKQLGVN